MSRAEPRSVATSSSPLVRRALVILGLAVCLGASTLARAQPEGSGSEEAAPPRERGRSSLPDVLAEQPAPVDAATLTAAPSSGPWRIAPAIGAPRWLDFGATHRTRYEQVFQQPRPGAPGDDLGLSLRTTLRGELRLDGVRLGVELVDSRLYLADSNTPLDTTLIDPLDILRAYVEVELRDVGQAGARLVARAGRITLDLGSRRLVARNRFRNTINAFTGVDLEWTSTEHDVVRVLAVLPVARRPTDRVALVDHAIELDREHLGTTLFGLHVASRPLADGFMLEGYLLGLYERDTSEAPTADRRFVTPGARLVRGPAPGRLDLEVEATAQLGTSRASRDPDDAVDLEHLAFFGHASVGYTVDVEWRPRVVLQWDYASGDASPNDGVNGRFDTLYGARRFEYGPTGLWGAVARSNLHSPGVRVEVTPHAMLDAFVAYRPVWLAQAADAWTGVGLRDPTGRSGDFVGHQLEARLRFQLAGNVTLEAGLAHLFRGSFATQAPNANPGGDPTYVHAGAAFEL